MVLKDGQIRELAVVAQAHVGFRAVLRSRNYLFRIQLCGHLFAQLLNSKVDFFFFFLVKNIDLDHLSDPIQYEFWFNVLLYSGREPEPKPPIPAPAPALQHCFRGLLSISVLWIGVTVPDPRPFHADPAQNTCEFGSKMPVECGSGSYVLC